MSRPHTRRPNTVRASRILGTSVVNGSGEDVGKIEDVVLDVHRATVAYAVLSFGGILGIGHRHFAVPWGKLLYEVDAGKYVLDVHKDRLARAPGFDPEHWPDTDDPRFGEEVHAYYATPARD